MISFIVAVYNKEKFLNECVDSILAQDYPDFEILLIDDGSTDSSGKICDDYISVDKRIRVFHTVNKGPGAARNKGIDEARGEYISFIDADDWIDRAFLSSILDDGYEAYDVIFYRYVFEYSDGVKVYDFAENKRSGSNICNDIIRLNGRYTFESNCSKLVRRSLLIEKEIRYKTELRTYEDWLFTYDIGKWMRSYLMINAGDYHARYTDEEMNHLSKQRMSLERNHEMYKKITAHALKIPHDNKWVDFLYARLFIMIDGMMLYSDDINELLNNDLDDDFSAIAIARHYLKRADLSLLGYSAAGCLKYHFYYYLPFRCWYLVTRRLRLYRMKKRNV